MWIGTANFGVNCNPYQDNVHSVDMHFFAVFGNLVISLNKQRGQLNLVWCQLAFPLQRVAFL